eukprot:SM000114S24163  [mRNA]  locus=s114:407368:416437:+ [translate_table: standard]
MAITAVASAAAATASVACARAGLRPHRKCSMASSEHVATAICKGKLVIDRDPTLAPARYELGPEDAMSGANGSTRPGAVRLPGGITVDFARVTPYRLVKWSVLVLLFFAAVRLLTWAAQATIFNASLWMYMSWFFVIWPWPTAIALGIWTLALAAKTKDRSTKAWEQLVVLGGALTWLILVPLGHFQGYVDGWPLFLFFFYLAFFCISAVVRKRLYGDLTPREKDKQWETTPSRLAQIAFIVSVVAGHWFAAREALYLEQTMRWSNGLALGVLSFAFYLHWNATYYLGKYFDRLVVPRAVVMFGPYRWHRLASFTVTTWLATLTGLSWNLRVPGTMSPHLPAAATSSNGEPPPLSKLTPVADAWLRATTSVEPAESEKAARELAALVKAGGIVPLEEAGIFSKLQAAAMDGNAESRLGALHVIKSLSENKEHSCEPYLLELLPAILDAFADKAPSVRKEADKAGKALMYMACPHAATMVLPVLFDAMENRKKWLAQQGSLILLWALAKSAPKQVGKSLPAIVPKVSEHMVDGKEQVMKTAYTAMLACAKNVNNSDINDFVPSLVSCIARPGEVPDCVHTLSGITFVQPVTAATLSIMVPLLIRGLKERATAVKRKTAVVIENMAKLVDNPADAAPFLPLLIPGLEKLAKEVADPECRQTAGKAAATLVSIGNGEQHFVDDSQNAKGDVSLIISSLKEILAAAVRQGENESPLLATTLRFVGGLCCRLIDNNILELEEWSPCVSPYIAPFLLKPEDSGALTQTFLAKCKQLFCKESVDNDWGDEDEEGEDLCNCEFSLGYGGKILLNNSRLWLKRGRRYGLCGPNGAGKSTLMRAIANGQLNGFPPPDELKTVYVEHDLDASLVDMEVLELMLADPLIKGVNKEKVVDTLKSVGFDDEKLKLPITALSGGWKMKLAIARAMIYGADVLLLDEPTNHLDVTNIAWLENYLVDQTQISSIIVSHDSGFLDNVCTDIIHYEKRKLRHYKGNLSSFVKVKPEAKVYYDLNAVGLKFTFPTPGYLEGIKTKLSPILKITGVHFTYPGASKKTLDNVNLQCSLSSRVGVVGANGAGKSTLIKLLTGELKAQEGKIWKHPNLGIAYVAQHAFHHVEQHLEKSPSEYIRWRYERGEDREELHKVHRKISKEEEANMQQLITHEGKAKIVERLLARRKSKKSYEYEVQWLGLKPVWNSWLSREMLEHLGFEKLVNEIDAKEVARLGVYNKPLTIAGVQEHFNDFGLEAEFGTYGGQKVKVVLAAAMWSNPHMIVLDEPTNFLDRDSLGALAGAIKDFGGAVLVISHNREFMAAICNETWTVADGNVTAPTNAGWLAGQRLEAARLKLEEAAKAKAAKKAGTAAVMPAAVKT